MKTSPPSPEQRTFLRELLTRPVARLDLAPPGMMGSVMHTIDLEPRDAVKLAGSSIDFAISEARIVVANDPFGQARGIVDAGNGQRWLLPAVSTAEPQYDDQPTAHPMFLSKDIATRKLTDVALSLEAIVDDQFTMTVERDYGSPLP